MHRFLFFLFLSALLTFYACSPRHQDYCFFVAGHVYGAPADTFPGLHPPFLADWDYLRALPNLKQGVFTGDIVYYSRPAYWDAVDQAVEQLKVPVYFAPGNHDEGHKEVYQTRYGLTYRKFEVEKDLFIVLNPGLGGWNIWKEQRHFLQSALAKAKKYHNIFIFCHQVLWWSPQGEYRQVRPNSLDGRSPEINFWPEVVPMLVATERPVYLFAGDVGANHLTQALSFYQHQNLHLLTSGMGAGTRDNYLIIGVDVEKKVHLAVRWLQSLQTEPLSPSN